MLKKWYESKTLILTIFFSLLMLADVFSDLLPGKWPQYVSGVYAVSMFALKMLDRKLFAALISSKEASDNAVLRSEKKTAHSGTKKKEKEEEDA